tara:strand:+ start:589 stop:1545 length:957 start_codon:yes stop_codon:yes gene_type:complete
MAEEVQDNTSILENDLDETAKEWEKELALESGEELPTDEDNQLTQKEPEEEAGSEEDEAEEEYETEEEEEEDVFEVKSDGKTHQVTLQELKDSFSKGQNYTRKSQTLAEERSALEETQAETRQAREQALQALEFARQQQPQVPERTEEYWTNLRESDPVQFLIERDAIRDSQVQNQMVDQQMMELNAQKEAERSENLGKYIDEQKVELLKLVPEWEDSKLADAEKKLVMEYGRKVGFTQEELDKAYDSRAVATMRKAALWDQLQAKKQGIKPVKRQSMKPGSKSGDPGKIKVGKAAERLKKSGRVEDAAAIFYNHIRS